MTDASTESAVARLAARIDGAAARNGGRRRYYFAMTELKPVRPRTGWLYVAIAVRADGSEPSRTPLAMGIVSGGGRLVKPWFELRIYPTVEMAGEPAFEARPGAHDNPGIAIHEDIAIDDALFHQNTELLIRIADKIGRTAGATSRSTRSGMWARPLRRRRLSDGFPPEK